MILRSMIILLIFVAPFGAGCSKSDHAASEPSPSSRDTDLVRQAVEDHVRNDREINLSAMDMNVDSIKLNGDQAQANVTFRAKQGGATMAIIYSLERRGNGWQVSTAQPADGEFVHPSLDATHPVTSPNPNAPAMPDIQEFLKNHPATSKN